MTREELRLVSPWSTETAPTPIPAAVAAEDLIPPEDRDSTPDAEPAVRILVADDHPLVVRGIVAALSREPDLEVVGQVYHPGEILDALYLLNPDVAVLDLRMQGTEGLELVARVRCDDRLVTRILLLTGETRTSSVPAVLNSGAAGFMCKSEPIETLCQGIRCLVEGKPFLSEEAQAALFEELRREGGPLLHRRPRPGDARLLTDRELEILRLTARGRSIAQIGRELNMSASTVKNHRQHVYAKLDVPNAPAAVHQAMRKGLLG